MMIIDNFIKNKNLLKILKDEKTWDGFPKFNWWDGWWVRKPGNILEEIIKTIWINLSNVENAVAGFEYWTNTQIANQKDFLDWHKDLDQKLFNTEQKFSTTASGHVLYVSVENLEGGFLEISSDNNPHVRINREQAFNKPPRYEDLGEISNPWSIEKTVPSKYIDLGFKKPHIERIKPIENRLIMFDPSKWHRVSKVFKGRRRAFLSNAWLKKPRTFDSGNHVDKDFQLVKWINEKKLKKV